MWADTEIHTHNLTFWMIGPSSRDILIVCKGDFISFCLHRYESILLGHGATRHVRMTSTSACGHGTTRPNTTTNDNNKPTIKHFINFSGWIINIFEGTWVDSSRVESCQTRAHQLNRFLPSLFLGGNSFPVYTLSKGLKIISCKEKYRQWSLWLQVGWHPHTRTAAYC